MSIAADAIGNRGGGPAHLPLPPFAQRAQPWVRPMQGRNLGAAGPPSLVQQQARGLLAGRDVELFIPHGSACKGGLEGTAWGTTEERAHLLILPSRPF